MSKIWTSLGLMEMKFSKLFLMKIGCKMWPLNGVFKNLTYLPGGLFFDPDYNLMKMNVLIFFIQIGWNIWHLVLLCWAFSGKTFRGHDWTYVKLFKNPSMYKEIKDLTLFTIFYIYIYFKQQWPWPNLWHYLQFFIYIYFKQQWPWPNLYVTSKTHCEIMVDTGPALSFAKCEDYFKVAKLLHEWRKVFIINIYLFWISVYDIQWLFLLI